MDDAARPAGAGELNSRLVRARLDVPAAHAAAAAVCDHPAARDLYPGLLALEHQVVRATVPLLRTAGKEAVRRGATGDAVAIGLTDHLRRQERDDLHHDDRLLDDYAALDRDPAEIVETPPPPAVAAMVGAVYYWILHFHPVAILGYRAVLDGAPPSPDLVTELIRRTGHPTEAFRTFQRHAVVGPIHAAERWAILDALDLTTTQLGLVTTVARHTLALYAAAIEGLLSASSSPAPSAEIGPRR